YGAAGTPAIGSPIGVNRQILSQFGMPAPEDDAEWLDAILDFLTKSSFARASLGRRAREVTVQHYSYDAWLSRWEAAVGMADSSNAAWSARETDGREARPGTSLPLPGAERE